jgi:hypothetical protein
VRSCTGRAMSTGWPVSTSSCETQLVLFSAEYLAMFVGYVAFDFGDKSSNEALNATVARGAGVC